MDSWFTVEEIDDQTFAISEYKHWEETHCYLLCGREKAVLIDTGLGGSDIKRIVDSLTKLPVAVITTHVHWDHIGGHGLFDDIAVHEAEKDWISVSFPLPLQRVRQELTKIPCEFPSGFDIDSYQVFRGEPKKILHDGDVLDPGGRTIRVIHTPGHSPGHCCFYEPERKYMYTGDLIYKGCLYAFYPSTDPKLFYSSVKRLTDYDIDRVLPSHHDPEVPVSMIREIEAGFAQIERSGRLEQGNGLFEFGDFQIRI